MLTNGTNRPTEGSTRGPRGPKNDECHGGPMSHCTVLDLCHTVTVIAAVVMIQCDAITSPNGVFFDPFIVQNDKIAFP